MEVTLVMAAVRGRVAVHGNAERTPRSLALVLPVCAPGEGMPVCLKAVPAGSHRCWFLPRSRHYPGPGEWVGNYGAFTRWAAARLRGSDREGITGGEGRQDRRACAAVQSVCVQFRGWRNPTASVRPARRAARWKKSEEVASVGVRAGDAARGRGRLGVRGPRPSEFCCDLSWPGWQVDLRWPDETVRFLCFCARHDKSDFK